MIAVPAGSAPESVQGAIKPGKAHAMVFRKESRIDSFQRQINALRSQIGDVPAAEEPMMPAAMPATPDIDMTRDMPGFGTGFGAIEEPVFRMPNMASGQIDHPFAQPAGMPAFQHQPVSEMPMVDEGTSVVSRSTMWRGDLESDGNVVVHGRVQGTVTARNEVYIAEDAEVEASVNADVVVVMGMVRGTITCTGRCEVLPTARILGDVFAPALVVQEGALVSGNVTMTTESASRQQLGRRSAWSS